MSRGALGPIAACLLAVGGVWEVRAQSRVPDSAALPLRPSISTGDEGSPSGCGTEAGLYASGGMRVWITRQGTVEQDNPLRPLSRDKLLVLQVAVNGRLATAFGPDYDNMRQGGSVQRLEEESGNAVKWSPDSSTFPDAIRIVAEDGRVLLGPLAFQGCGAAPRVAAPAPAPRRVPAARAPEDIASPRPNLPAERARPAERPGLPMPQGAIH